MPMASAMTAIRGDCLVITSNSPALKLVFVPVMSAIHDDCLVLASNSSAVCFSRSNHFH